jgi:hypothetical protein
VEQAVEEEALPQDQGGVEVMEDSPVVAEVVEVDASTMLAEITQVVLEEMVLQ